MNYHLPHNVPVCYVPRAIFKIFLKIKIKKLKIIDKKEIVFLFLFLFLFLLLFLFFHLFLFPFLFFSPLFTFVTVRICMESRISCSLVNCTLICMFVVSLPLPLQPYPVNLGPSGFFPPLKKCLVVGDILRI